MVLGSEWWVIMVVGWLVGVGDEGDGWGFRLLMRGGLG